MQFVGFAASPKPEPGRKIKKLQFKLELSSSLRDVLAALSTPELYSQLLDEVTKFDFRPGGRLLLNGESEYRGAFSQIAIPSRIILATEQHGEIEFRFKELKTGSRVVVSIKKALLPEEQSDWEAKGQKIERVLRENFGG